MHNSLEQKRRVYINYVGLALFIGIFFNLVYDVLKHYGLNSPEWFWYVGLALETTILYLIIRSLLGRHWITSLSIYVMIGVFVKEAIGIPFKINFLEYPVILAAGLIDRYLINKKNENK